MPLAAIAHEAGAYFLQRRVWRPHAHNRLSLHPHGIIKAIDQRPIERIQAYKARTHHFIADRRGKKAMRGAYTCPHRHQDAIHAELLCHTYSMQRCGTTKSDHGAPAGFLAIFYRMHTRRISHSFGDDFSNAKRCFRRRHAKRVSYKSMTRGMGRRGIKRYVPPRKARRIDP